MKLSFQILTRLYFDFFYPTFRMLVPILCLLYSIRNIKEQKFKTIPKKLFHLKKIGSIELTAFFFGDADCVAEKVTLQLSNHVIMLIISNNTSY